MWDWLKKVGKVALAASPYIAAPFTGGASLMLAPAANMAEKKWIQHDANENIKKGIAPSSFDKYLGMGSDIASIAAPTGALGAFGKLGNTAGKIGKIAGVANAGLGATGILANAARNNGANLSQGGNTGQNTSGNPFSVPGGNRDFAGSTPFPGTANPGVMPVGGYDYNNNPLNQIDQSSPNLSYALFQGRQDALKNQPRSIFKQY